MKSLQVILHPTDFSTNAQHACQVACTLARDRDARLILLHVTPPLPPQLATSNISLLDPYNKRWEADRKLRGIDCGDLRPGRLLRSGDPATVILEMAERLNADLIVLGQPRRGNWWWLIDERVAETVVRKASRPVLIATRDNAVGTPYDRERKVRSNVDLHATGSLVSGDLREPYTAGYA